MTQTFIGIGIVSAVLSGALNVVLPAPQPITINSLSFDGAIVIQDRTVRADNPAGLFWGLWSAQVVNAETGKVVPQCDGVGSWNYSDGRKAVKMDLARWTGSAACTRAGLDPGIYTLQATWHWGDSQTAAVSPSFEVK